MWRAYFRKLSLTAWKSELASRWDFFGIGIFNFKLDRKIPKISKFWVQDRDSEIPQDSEWESPKIPGIGVGIWKPRNTSKKSHAQKPENPDFSRIFLHFGIFSPGFSQNFRNLWKLPEIFIHRLWDFLSSGYSEDFPSPGSGFFFLGRDIAIKSHIFLKMHLIRLF